MWLKQSHIMGSVEDPEPTAKIVSTYPAIQRKPWASVRDVANAKPYAADALEEAH